MKLTKPVVSDQSVGDLAPGIDGMFRQRDANLDCELDICESWRYTASYTATQDDIDHRIDGVPTVFEGRTRDNRALGTSDQGACSSDLASVPIEQNPHVTLVKNAAVLG